MVSPEEYVGGSGIYLVKIIRHLVRRHTVHLLLHPSAEMLEYLQRDAPEVVITKAVMTYRRFPQLLVKISRLVHQKQIQIIHLNGRRLVALAPIIKLLCRNIKLVSTFHSAYFNRDESVLKSFALWLLHLVPVHFCDRVIAVSEKIHRERKSQLLPIKKNCLIKNGIDIERFMLPQEIRQQFRREVRQRYGLNDAVVIGEVARLVKGKGQHILLSALAICRRRRAHFKILLVGDGPSRAELESLSRQLQLDSAVIFAGHQADPRPFLAAMDVFVLPSLNEGLPLSLLEAMAMGLPVVAARSGGIPELIDDLKTGLLAPPNDVEALALRLQELLDDMTLRERLAAKARAVVKANFDQQKMLALHDAVYDELISVK
ncbi:MAG: glycosyltransferase family 4 protein [candidate division KSB1 bacterium]|nr:glycosyltransferase family 4 protein [candidate division KSB1 bacterium]MDZ7403524.1 glycosyltransferase family 4 protein [candidate division KSB1 bacterium]